MPDSNRGRCACGGIAFTGALIDGVFTPFCADHKKQYDKEQAEKVTIADLTKQLEEAKRDLAQAGIRERGLTARLEVANKKIAAFEEAEKSR